MVRDCRLAAAPPTSNAAMSATTLVLVRHGETSWNGEGRIQGHADIALNSLGIAQLPDLQRICQRDLALRRALENRVVGRRHPSAAGIGDGRRPKAVIGAPFRVYRLSPIIGDWKENALPVTSHQLPVTNHGFTKGGTLPTSFSSITSSSSVWLVNSALRIILPSVISA